VAREAGVAAPSVYLQFANKDELLLAVVVEHFAAFQRVIEDAIAPISDPAAGLYAGCLAYCRFGQEHPGSYRIIFELPLPRWSDLPTGELPGMSAFAVLVAGVAECIAAGVARPGDPERIATDIWMALHGMVSLRRHLTGFPWPDIEEQLRDILQAMTGIPYRDDSDHEGGSMSQPRNLFDLPADLPIPVDDGACAHLPGMTLPALALPATDGTVIDLAELPGRSVVYVYPRTGRPDQPLPTGWDAIPGARGCTPQSCAYRDLAAEFAALGSRIFGLSTQDTVYQQEAAARLHLPFPLLSDEHLAFASALHLPTFTVDGMTLIRRLTLVIHDGVIETVFYPVFPPDADAANVASWLREHAT
jgi:peroxiredoxin/AcrR family transcriptional regulator